MDANASETPKIPPPVDLNIPGWDMLVRDHMTRMLVYKALVELTCEYAVPPTKAEILERVREMQRKFGLPVLSPKSLKTVQDHLNRLLDGGWVYISKFKGTSVHLGKKKRGMGRGGAARVYIPIHIKVITAGGGQSGHRHVRNSSSD